jgi:hypothetical protein
MTILVPGEIGIKTFGVSTKTTRNLIDPVTSQPIFIRRQHSFG